MRFIDIYFDPDFYDPELYNDNLRLEETFGTPGHIMCRCHSEKVALSIIIDHMVELGLDPKQIKLNTPYRNVQEFTNNNSNGLWTAKVVYTYDYKS